MDLASLLTGDNAAFIDQAYMRYLEDPRSVDPEWREVFRELPRPTDGQTPGRVPVWRRRSIFNPVGVKPGGSEVQVVSERQTKVAQLINAWRVRGHMVADLDPLHRLERTEHPELTLAYYGLTEADLDVPVTSRPLFGVPEVTTLRHILSRLRAAYGGSIGAEFMNIQNLEQKVWVQEQLETLHDEPVLDREHQLRVLDKLIDADAFERFLHTRFPGTKRFSLEGNDSLIPLMDLLAEEAAASGVKELVIGMAHRGRLNVLANTLEKPAHLILGEFQDEEPDTVMGSGDVKYHLGFSHDATTLRGDHIHLGLTFNPSHLEAVNAVVEGRTRAKQEREGRGSSRRCMPVVMHGDAAFAGQGTVAEVLNLGALHGYRSGGTIHIVVNNQIGFTAAPRDSRSTPYATDVARMMAIPILHVNGEDPEAVAACVKLAVAWRQRFREDVVIDLYGFRRHGHNEGDDPSITQPEMVRAIKTMKPTWQNYAATLVEQGVIPPGEAQARYQAHHEAMDQALEDVGVKAPPPPPPSQNPLRENWRYWTSGTDKRVDTTYPRAELRDLLHRANELPDDFHGHKTLKRLLKRRLQMADGERPCDWGLAEQAAFATLLVHGFRVRISGQDSQRGTFAHRHAQLIDIENGHEYYPLDHLAPGQAPFRVYDSMLSEAGVLGFEFGYSLDYPDALVIWEAQFGDFANGAQVMIDNFIVASEQKWGRHSGLVMLLPHGYEGQGPEHSSARLERFMMLCAEDNIQIVNATTPANLFHLMRRQVLRKIRKPLIVMSPKSLLRHPDCVSSIDELAEGRFHRVIGDAAELADVRRVVLCSGKVFYDLDAARTERGQADVALVRVEELYPYPSDRILEEVERYPGAEVVWAQEEPRNMGAWPVYCDWLRELLPADRQPRYVGRKPAASPATGSHKVHVREQQQLIEEALS